MFKENKKIISILIGISFLFTMLIAGYLARLSNIKQNAQKNIGIKTKLVEENIKKYQDEEDLKYTKIQDSTISPETNMVYKIVYKKCGHELVKRDKPLEDMVGLNRKEFESYAKDKLLDWKLSMYSKDEISLISEKNTLCTNHFVVGETGGNITIFKIDENGDRVIHRIFKDATISTVREENQERLKQGIVVESEDEAIQVLEDFIS